MESDRVETLSLRLRSNCESEGSLLCYTDYTTICIQAVQYQVDKYLEENDIGEHNHFGEDNLWEVDKASGPILSDMAAMILRNHYIPEVLNKDTVWGLRLLRCCFRRYTRAAWPLLFVVDFVGKRLKDSKHKLMP